MTLKYSSRTSQELVLQLVMENIEFRKRSLYLQEIVSLSKASDVLTKMLSQFLQHNTPKLPLRSFSKN